MSDDLATKTVNTFMEITTLGIKVIRPKRTSAEKAKTEREKQVLRGMDTKAGRRNFITTAAIKYEKNSNKMVSLGKEST